MPWSFSSVSLLIIGIAKANVFPVPVFARPIISRPSNAGINTALYMVKRTKTQFAFNVIITEISLNNYKKGQIQTKTERSYGIIAKPPKARITNICCKPLNM